MITIWHSGNGEGPRRFGGKRSDPASRGRSNSHGSRRNPLLAPENAEEQSSRGHQERQDPLSPMGEDLAQAGKAEPSTHRRRRPHSDATDRAASVKKAPVGLTHIGFLLAGLALGVMLLMSMNHLYSVLSQSKEEKEPEAVATAQAPPAPPPAVAPKALQHATEPTQAIKLMLAAAARGDVATAYAQWDIAPEDLATVKRGQEMTLSEVVEKARVSASPLQNQQFRVISRSAAEARVAQLSRGLRVQIFSLRKQGPYWKLYNASAP